MQRLRSIYLSVAVFIAGTMLSGLWFSGAVMGTKIGGSLLVFMLLGWIFQLEGWLRRAATSDIVTRLPNRLAFDQVLRKTIHRPITASATAVLLIDIDDFKSVNDTLGHDAGDELLRQVARRIRESTNRPGDVTCRLGGDEFAVMLRNIRRIDDAHRVASRILKAVRPPFAVNGREVFVRASIGIASSDGPDGTERVAAPSELLRRADTAMYEAKAQGKDRVEVFQSAMSEANAERALLETDLRLALERNEFFLEYQPIERMSDQSTVGAEALVRWLHPTRGVLSPLEFVDLTERIGLSTELAHFVIRNAVRTLFDWRTMGQVSPTFVMSVNLSATQLLSRTMPEFISQVLARYPIPASALTIEITETVLMGDADTVRDRLNELKALGLGIALDDFGTGYTSVKYLSDFPIDVMKIDRSLVQGVETDPRKASLARAVVGLATAIGITALAEGIETRGQQDVLMKAGCSLGQGFYIGRAVSAATFGPAIPRSTLGTMTKHLTPALLLT